MSEQAAWFTVQPEEIPESELTLAGFYSQWGGQLRFDGEQFARLWERAALFYPDCPEHGFSRAVETAWRANMIVDSSEATYGTLNRDLITAMSFFSGACQHSDPHISGFETREARAGFILYKNAPSFGFTYPEAYRGRRGVESTRPSVRPFAPEDTLLNLAVLYNVSANYKTVVEPRAEEIIKEAALKYGEKFDFTRFAASGIRRLLKLTSLDRLTGQFQLDEWQKRVDENLRQWVANTAESAGTSFPNYVQGLGSLATTRLLQV